MPTAEAQRRHIKNTRTVKLPGGHYMHCDVVDKAGPKGGHTVCGPVKTKKGKK